MAHTCRSDAVTDEQQIAALREEIRRAGRAAVQARVVAGVVGLGACVALVFGDALIALGPEGRIFPHWDALIDYLFLVMLAGALGCAMGPAMAAAAGPLFRRSKVRGIVKRLGTVERQDAEAALASLHNDPSSDARKIAAVLLRRLTAKAAAEIAPANPPNARGDEASPVERAL
jgi:hypothetical protein